MVCESVIFMFWSALGAFQIIASWGRFEGLSFFSHCIAGYIFGAANIIAAFWWFFTTIQIGEDGLKGQHYEQFVSVALGVSAAALLTGITSSIIKSRIFKQEGEIGEIEYGIDVFRRATFFQIIRQHIGKNKRPS